MAAVPGPPTATVPPVPGGPPVTFMSSPAQGVGVTFDAADSLAFRIGELMRADNRIALLARAPAGDPGSRAAAMLEAIADRERIAGAVLAAVACEDRALQSSMNATAGPADLRPRPDARLIRRDRSIEALISHVQHRTERFHRIARRLESALEGPGGGRRLRA